MTKQLETTALPEAKKHAIHYVICNWENTSNLDIEVKASEI